MHAGPCVPRNARCRMLHRATLLLPLSGLLACLVILIKHVTYLWNSACCTSFQQIDCCTMGSCGPEQEEERAINHFLPETQLMTYHTNFLFCIIGINECDPAPCLLEVRRRFKGAAGRQGLGCRHGHPASHGTLSHQTTGYTACSAEGT